MKSGPLSIFLSASDNSVKLFKRPSKPLGSLKWPVPVDFGRKGRLKALPSPLSSEDEKRNPFRLSLGLVSGTRTLLSCNQGAGRLAGGDDESPLCKQGWAGGLGVLSCHHSASHCRNS